VNSPIRSWKHAPRGCDWSRRSERASAVIRSPKFRAVTMRSHRISVVASRRRVSRQSVPALSPCFIQKIPSAKKSFSDDFV
jgi:hypothetical protein